MKLFGLQGLLKQHENDTLQLEELRKTKEVSFLALARGVGILQIHQ